MIQDLIFGIEFSVTHLDNAVLIWGETHAGPPVVAAHEKKLDKGTYLQDALGANVFGALIIEDFIFPLHLKNCFLDFLSRCQNCFRRSEFGILSFLERLWLHKI